MSVGKLRSNTTISYKTRHVKRLIQGRPASETKPPIVGLIRFGQLVFDIYKAASNDNPYAHHYLLRVERSLNTMSEYFVHKSHELDNYLRNGVVIGDVVSGEPEKIAARFGAPFGYQAAYVLQDADNYIAKVINLAHVGLIPPKSKAILIEETARKLRGMFETISGWKLFHVTTADVENDNKNAERAKKHFKFDLDPGVISGGLRAEFAPPSQYKNTREKPESNIKSKANSARLEGAEIAVEAVA